MTTIETLVAELDAETRANLPSKRTLVLLGDLEKSPFLRALKRKADSFGVDVVTNFKPVTACCVVADKETFGDVRRVWRLSAMEDLDNQYHDGMSGVSEAVLFLLNRKNLVNKRNITIVGRGHSVKGLAEALTAHDATVTIAHSHTPCLLTATKGKDVVIYATPRLDKVIAYDTTELVIDLGGVVKYNSWFYCDYVKNIGPLTISLLLNRLVMGR